MAFYDARCNTCEHLFEERRNSGEPVSHCPLCGNESRTVWTSVPILDKAKDPFDLITCGTVPSSKKTKSFANDKRRGGKDTT